MQDLPDREIGLDVIGWPNRDQIGDEGLKGWKELG
jgi:hypothetical protein